MAMRSQGREIRKHDTDVHRTRECACAETTDRLGNDFGEIDWADDTGLSDSKTSDQQPSEVDLPEPTGISELLEQ